MILDLLSEVQILTYEQYGNVFLHLFVFYVDSNMLERWRLKIPNEIKTSDYTGDRTDSKVDKRPRTLIKHL